MNILDLAWANRPRNRRADDFQEFRCAGLIYTEPLAEIRFEDIELLNYQHHPFIKFEVSV